LRGITAKELGHIINVAESTISLYENGKRAPDYVTLLKIANYFDVSTDYLLDRDEGQNGQDQPSASFAKLGQVIKELRRKRGLTLNDMAEDLEISQRTLYDIEQYRAQPTLALVNHLAEYFDVSIDHLMGRDSIPTERLSDLPWINVLGRVAAGIPIEAVEEIIDREQLSPDMDLSYEYIGLKIHGDSMEPKMSEGDVVIVRLQDDCNSGDIAVVLVNGNEATCKKIKKMPEGIMLISTNPNYEPMFYSNKQIEELPVRLIGKVVELRSKF